MLALDLFCGGGGVGLAMVRCGLRPLGVDLDANALAMYRHVGDTFQGNVAELDPVEVWGQRPAPWLIWASPPLLTLQRSAAETRSMSFGGCG